MFKKTLMVAVFFAPASYLFSNGLVFADPLIAITNTPNVTVGGSQLTNTTWKGLIFSTPDWVSKISSVGIGLNKNSGTYPVLPNLGISLYTVNSGAPSSQIYSLPLQSVSLTGGQQMYSFTIPDWQMAANTSYALVLTSDLNGIKWGSTGNSPGGTVPSGLNGFTYQSFSYTDSSGSSWTSLGVPALNAVVMYVTHPTMSSDNTYSASNLGISVNPIFQGATLQMNQNALSYSQNFTLANSVVNTIDQFGNTSTFSGVFSDETNLGRLVIANTGTANQGSVTLSGVNTHTGGTQVNAGANLSISSGSALGSGTLALVGSASIPATLSTTATTTIANAITVSGDPVFNVASGTTTTVSGVISDGVASGDVVVQGGGTLNLTNINTYTGPTTIASGSTLALTGSGSIAASSGVSNAGGLDISNSTSTVNFGGNYTQSSTGNLVMKDLTPASSQLLNITGSAALGGTLTLNATAGAFVPHRYTLLTATGGVSSHFTSLATNLSSLTRLGYALSYDANDVYLNFTPNVSDTQAALEVNASALRGIYAIQTGTINNSLTYDCSYFDKNGFCVSTGGRYSNATNAHANTTAAMVIGGYRLDDHTRFGAYVDQNLYNTEAGSVASLRSNTPLIGVFGVWNENPDQTGFEARVAAAYNNSNIDVNRMTVATSELGYGKTGIDTLSGSATLAYGFEVGPKWITSPYFGVRHTTVSSTGYSEQATTAVTAPLTYKGVNQESLTALLGIKAAAQLTEQIGLQASAGLEQDMHTYTSAYSASGLDGLTAINLSPNMQKSRAVTTFGTTYDLAKGHRIGLTGIYRQESFQSVDTKMAYLTYTMGF